MFNFRRKHQRHRHGHGHEAESSPAPVKVPEGGIPITEAPEEERLVVLANSDKKTMEMGLYPGSRVTLLHNESAERNIIVKVHDQRYVIPREIGAMIFVKK